jgi:hypothetical protein
MAAALQAIKAGIVSTANNYTDGVVDGNITLLAPLPTAIPGVPLTGAVDINASFTLASGYLVFFMHCGFAMVSRYGVCSRRLPVENRGKGLGCVCVNCVALSHSSLRNVGVSICSPANARELAASFFGAKLFTFAAAAFHWLRARPLCQAYCHPYPGGRLHERARLVLLWVRRRSAVPLLVGASGVNCGAACL